MPAMSAARVVKTPDEIELLKQSAAIADACTYKARYEWAKPGITERELSGKMIEYMYSKGCEIVYEIRCLLAYTADSGLVSDEVPAVAVDRNGQRWIGTRHGISKFDGQSWTTYTTANDLPHNEIRSLAVDAAGRVWAATWGGGVSYFDGQQWTTYTTTGLADKQGNAIAIDRQGLPWFATPGGVSRFDGQQWTAYTALDGLVDPYANTIVVDADDLTARRIEPNLYKLVNVLRVDDVTDKSSVQRDPGVLFWSDPASHLEKEVVGAMARELARLHATQPPASTLEILPRIAPAELEWQRFQQAKEELSQVFPALAPRLQRLASILTPLGTGVPNVLLHGSFHPAQFLIDAGTPRLMDFDAVCLGDPMYDLARFASHLYGMGQVNGQELSRIEKAVSAFRWAYASSAGSRFEASRWFWFLAVALVAKRARQVLKRLEVDAEIRVKHLPERPAR